MKKTKLYLCIWWKRFVLYITSIYFKSS